ncbi:hypothetical protein D9757_015168 [Collybiopsis confluens]|uniref:LOV domain-containing protein n=1 Tax=Collybiopsis confluens TaxID=2823264 RepID=A0A8H5CUM7_9AGAR|nr:hypothetical protein D9757_015168 [Collybiopsis confluens]
MTSSLFQHKACSPSISSVLALAGVAPPWNVKYANIPSRRCQTSIISYRKSGKASVIPIKGGDVSNPQKDDKVIYHVGFQVDLTEQPNAILEKLSLLTMRRICPMLMKRHPVTASTNTDAVSPPSAATPPFLCLPPPLRRVLRYKPKELVGKGLVDICHHADQTPAMNELKESGATAAGRTSSSGNNANFTSSNLPSNGNSSANSSNANFDCERDSATEFWGAVTCSGTLLVVRKGARDVLGFDETELMGRAIFTFLSRQEPWQYELQQNECLRDEIKSLQEEVGEEKKGKMEKWKPSPPATGITPSIITYIRLLRLTGQGQSSQPAPANPSLIMYSVLDAPSYGQLELSHPHSHQQRCHYHPQVQTLALASAQRETTSSFFFLRTFTLWFTLSLFDSLMWSTS